MMMLLPVLRPSPRFYGSLDKSNNKEAAHDTEGSVTQFLHNGAHR